MKKALLTLFSIAIITIGCTAPQVEEKKTETTSELPAEKIGTQLNGGKYTTGSLTGTITIESETTALSGAYIYLEGSSYMAYSSTKGSYKIDNIPAGTYTLVCYKDNYLIEKRPGVLIEGGKESSIAVINLNLSPFEVIDTSPKGGTQYASIEFNYILTFNKALSMDSLKTAKVILQGGGKSYDLTRPPTELYHPTQLRFYLSSTKLDFSTDYTMTIEGLAGQDGSKMAAPKVVNFRTHSGGPKIISFSPADGSTDVALDSRVVLRFDREMDPATINSKNFTLWINRSNFLAQQITVSYDPIKKEATITPFTPFKSNMNYQIEFSMYYIKDINGIPMREIASKPYISYNFQTAHEDITSRLDKWVELISSDNPKTFVTLDVTKDSRYELAWDDLSEGTGKYSAKVNIKLYYKEGWSTTKVKLTGGGYSTPGTFTATKTGKLYLEYTPIDYKHAGLFALKVREIK